MLARKFRLAVGKFPRNSVVVSRNRAFVVRAVKNETENCRYGVIISAKNMPTAVKRNRIKRLVAECCRTHTAGHADFLWIVQAGAKNLIGKELQAEISAICKKLDQFK